MYKTCEGSEKGDSLAGVTVSSCYSVEEALCVPLVSKERQEGHNLISPRKREKKEKKEGRYCYI